MIGEQRGRGALPAALALSLLLGTFPQFALGALAPQLRGDLGIGPGDLGLVFAALYAIGVVGSPFAGPLADRLGGRSTCIGLLVVAAVALVGASTASSRTGLVLAMLPAGAAMALANPGTNRWASSAATPRRQATLVGVAQAGVQAGALVAGGLAALHAVGLDWRGALRIGAVVALAGVAVAAWSPRDATPVSQAPAPPAPTRRAGSGQTVLRSRLAVYALLMGAGTSVVFAYLPSFAVDEAGLSVAAAGATALVYGVVALICRLALGVILPRTDEIGPVPLVVMAVGAVVALGAIAAGVRDPAWMWVGTMLFGATGTTWPAIAFLAVVRASEPGTTGRDTGWMTAAFYLGLWITPPIAGQIVSAHGYAPAWAGAAVCYALATIPVTRTRRAPARS